ncbi:homeobox-leucine zipper protein ROC4-like [Triticum urartu]|uniref:Homeobox domain-containing protein n=1 Tax=Triticum urartu TaxID=4572 RepID=A0A8R7UAY1_TRIUA|nr:homeobox-leucine zipper protein ROC4-like [Triticum urartu]
MDEEWPQHNSVVLNDLDPFMTSEHNHLLQHDHGDETYGLLGATANVGMIDNTNVVAGNQGNNNGETYSQQRMETRRTNYHRLRREQIQQLESVFREIPYPDEKLRKTLSERLGMSAQQVKLWFQNHRNNSKGKTQRRETNTLQLVNQMLKSDRQAIMSAMENSTCLKCRGAVVRTQDTSERQRLFKENMKLKEELRLAVTHLKEGLQQNGMWPRLTHN